MRRLLQNVSVYYGGLALLAILLQLWWSSTYDEAIKAGGAKVDRVMREIKEHYDLPGGMTTPQVQAELNGLQQKVADGYRLLQEQVSFQVSPDYRIDPKVNYPSLEYQQRVNRFRAKNAERLKQLGTKCSASFLAGSQLDQSLERLQELLLQATIVEELFLRLEKEGLLAVVGSINASSPRSDSGQQVVKLVKKVTRFPIQVELAADPSELDRLFAGLGAGKGFFFLDNLELAQGNDPQQWSSRIRCKVDLSAVVLEMEKTFPPPTPIQPKWAGRVAKPGGH